MTLRAKYNEVGRKNKCNIAPANLDYQFCQNTNKFELSFNSGGVFQNQNRLQKYQLKAQQNTASPHYPYSRSPGQNNKYAQSQEIRNKKSEQSIKALSEITNLPNQVDMNLQKKYLIGSIKRNKPLLRVQQNKILHSQFFENGIDLQQIQQLRLSKMEEMEARLNKVIHKDNVLEFQQETKRQHRENKVLIQGIQDQIYSSAARQVNKNLVIQKSTQRAKQNNFPTCQHKKNQKFNEVMYLQYLFTILDGKNKGTLSKQNCRVQILSQEFKFIFGSIFTRIFLKKITCNKREFVKLCMNILKELNSSQIIDLLKLFTQRYQSRQNIFESQRQLFRQSNSDEKNIKIHFQNSDEPKQINFQSGNQYFSKDQNQYMRSFNCEMRKQRSSQKHILCKEKDFISKKSTKQSFFSSIKLKSISEQMIQQHKQSLYEMSELQRKMSEILKESYNLQNNLHSGAESLNFSELVKHI